MNDVTPEEAEFWRDYHERRRLKEEESREKLKYNEAITAKLRDLSLEIRKEYAECNLTEYLLLKDISRETSKNSSELHKLYSELRNVQERKLYLEKNYLTGDPIKLRERYIEKIADN